MFDFTSFKAKFDVPSCQRNANVER